MTTNANGSNSAAATSYGEDIIKASGLKQEYATISLMLADTHGDRYDRLLPLLPPLNPDANVRETLLNDFYSTPGGQSFGAEYATLAKIKDKSPTQAGRFEAMQAISNNLNTTIGRAVDVYRGIKLLRDKGRIVSVRRVKGLGDSKAYTCHVHYVNAALPADEQETTDDRVQFYASELMRVQGIVAAITDETTTDQLKVLCSKATLKTGTPNANPAPSNGTRIEPSKLADAVNSVDTTLAALTSDDGVIKGATKNVNESLDMLWARLDATFNDARKAKARAAYAALADETAKADAAKAEAEAKVKAEADAAAAAATAAAAAAPTPRRRRVVAA